MRPRTSGASLPAETGQRRPWSALTDQLCDSLQCRQMHSQEPGQLDLMHEVHEERRKGGGLSVSDWPVHFGLAVSFPEVHSAGRTAGAHDTFSGRRNKQKEEKERWGGGGGQGQVTGAAQGACRDGSRHQMAAHTGRCPMGSGRFPSSPSSRDSGLRHARHPGAELPEPGKHLGAPKRKRKQNKTPQKSAVSGFYGIRVLMELKTVHLWASLV